MSHPRHRFGGPPLVSNDYWDYETRRWVNPEADRHHHHYYHYSGWWWWLLILFLIIVGLWAVSYWTGPRYHYVVEPTTTLKSTMRVLPSDCTVGEYYDRNVGLCAPKAPAPRPIVNELKDKDVDPCESYYDYVCGKWIDAHTNEDRSFTYLYHKNQVLVQRIILDPTSGPAYRLYRSCLDTLVHGLHNQKEHMQLEHMLSVIRDTLTRIEDLPIVLARLARFGITSPFSISIEKHPKAPTMIPMLRADDFYAQLTLDNVTALMPSANAARHAWKVIQTLRSWRTTMEPANYVDYIQHDLDKDLYTFKQLRETTQMEHFWTEYLRELDGHGLDAALHDTEVFWVFNMPYLRQLLGNLRTHFKLVEWKCYVEFCIRESSTHYFPVLQSNVYFKHHDVQPFGPQVFLEHRLQRNMTVEPNGALCAQVVHTLLPGVIAKEYLHRYFTHEEQVRNQVTEVVNNIRNTFVEFIHRTTWMDQSTKDAAVDKLMGIIVRVIHPNTFGEEPFANRISQSNWLRNLNMIRQHRVARNIALWKSRNPLDRDTIQRFGMPISTINAYYSPITNTVTVFGGILSSPFYDVHFSLDAVYARIGTIVAHELSHSMDNHGRLWDKNGCFQNWWTPHSEHQFNTRAACLVHEYQAPDECNQEDYGQQTLGENLSDHTGILLAYHAYFDNTNEGQTKNRHERQDWWEMVGQMWCESMDMDHTCRRIQTDVHARGRDRINQCLRQDTNFHADYQCHPGQRMVNEDMCVIY